MPLSIRCVQSPPLYLTQINIKGCKKSLCDFYIHLQFSLLSIKMPWPEKRSHWKAEITMENQKKRHCIYKVRPAQPLSLQMQSGWKAFLWFKILSLHSGKLSASSARLESRGRRAAAPSPPQRWLCCWGAKRGASYPLWKYLARWWAPTGLNKKLCQRSEFPL